MLSEYLRDKLALTGTHIGCDTSQCGACVVHLNGNSVKSCTTLAVDCDGGEITTIEGLKTKKGLNIVQKAFKEFNAAQCGYCTSGIIISLSEIFNKDTIPTNIEISSSLEGQLCRCGSHAAVIKAINKLIESP